MNRLVQKYPRHGMMIMVLLLCASALVGHAEETKHATALQSGGDNTNASGGIESSLADLLQYADTNIAFMAYGEQSL